MRLKAEDKVWHAIFFESLDTSKAWKHTEEPESFAQKTIVKADFKFATDKGRDVITGITKV